ncbi:WD domain-containing [Pyrrhoderma noxium]|uniref:WD domain-containing n=1 Tax=Pyrrhoderma noxium TaxID=2282107 RepID=A0A286UPG1_9AGAM|nr:WD domain-containing [Pyrrhoderma noxium]
MFTTKPKASQPKYCTLRVTMKKSLLEGESNKNPPKISVEAKLLLSLYLKDSPKDSPNDTQKVTQKAKPKDTIKDTPNDTLYELKAEMKGLELIIPLGILTENTFVNIRNNDKSFYFCVVDLVKLKVKGKSLMTGLNVDIDIDIHKSTAEESAVLLSTNLLSNNNVTYLLHDVPKQLLDDDISDKSILKDCGLCFEMINLRRPLDDSASAAGTILKIALHLYELYEKGVIVSEEESDELLESCKSFYMIRYLRYLSKKWPRSQRTTLIPNGPMCLEGTCNGLLQEIEKWANNIRLDNVYLLLGTSGTGKSTIVRTIAEKFRKEGRLASYQLFQNLKDNSKDIELGINIDLAKTCHFPQDFYARSYALRLGNGSISSFGKLIPKPLPAGSKEETYLIGLRQGTTLSTRKSSFSYHR